jgi:hypothetical protein
MGTNTNNSTRYRRPNRKTNEYEQKPVYDETSILSPEITVPPFDQKIAVLMAMAYKPPPTPSKAEQTSNARSYPQSSFRHDPQRISI